jgi:hypothetical protein
MSEKRTQTTRNASCSRGATHTLEYKDARSHAHMQQTHKHTEKQQETNHANVEMSKT